MQLPIKPYIISRLKTSYAVEGPETQYTIDCGDGVNVHTVSQRAIHAVKTLDYTLAQVYPHNVTMKQAIQRYWAPFAQLPLERIFLGEGSQSLLYDVCRLFLEPGDQVIGIGPCYAEFASDVGMWGADYDFVALRPENRFAFDVEEFLSRMRTTHKLVYIDTPNNPTGQVIPLSQVELVVAKAQQLNLPIIVDEAYGDYMSQENSAINLAHRYDNLVVLRSFSKAHGLAGARAGYGVLPQQLCAPLDNITHPYICSSPARAIAQAALEDEGFLTHTQAVTAQLKKPFLRSWSKLFISQTHPDTPIFLLSHPDPTVQLKRAFDPFHIKVVSGDVFVGIGTNSVRLRVPLAQDQQAVLHAIEEIDRHDSF